MMVVGQFHGPQPQADLDGLPTQPPTQSDALTTLFIPQITSPDVTAAPDGNKIVLTGAAANTPFRVTGTDERVTDPASQLFDFSSTTAAPVVGNRYAEIGRASCRERV